MGKDDFAKTISFDELATGGSVVVFNSSRNLLDIVHEYMEFFVEESCGFCTPCRVGNALLKDRLEKILRGQGEFSDLDYMKELGETIKFSSRCGLGQTSSNPILSTIKNFRSIYDAVLKEEKEGLEPSFDINVALKEAESVTGRKSVYFNV